MSATWSLICSRRSSGVPGKAANLSETCGELCHSLYQGAERLQRPLPCLVPQARRLLDQASLGAVTRQQLRLVLSDL